MIIFTDSFHKFLSSAFAIAFVVKPVHLFYFNFDFGFDSWIWKGHIWHIEIAVKLISKLTKLAYNEFAVLRLKANGNLCENLAHCCSSSLTARFGQEARETLHIHFWLRFCDFTRLVRNDLNTDEILNRSGDAISNELNRIWIRGSSVQIV